jgi:hypothetical protein
VASRSIYLERGYAYVPLQKLVSIIVTKVLTQHTCQQQRLREDCWYCTANYLLTMCMSLSACLLFPCSSASSCRARWRRRLTASTSWAPTAALARC